MFSCKALVLVVRLLTRIGTCRQILIQLPNIKLNGNPLSDPRVVTFGRTDMAQCQLLVAHAAERFLGIYCVI